MNARKFLTAFQAMSAKGLTPGFLADFELMKHKDMDLSIRLGALLGFNALLLASAIQPISASPGAPLSLDAATQPLEALVIALGVVLLSFSGYLCVRGILIGEEFETDDLGDQDGEILKARLFDAFCRSIDEQQRALSRASKFTLAGGLVTLAGCLWIMVAKM